jgi:hypothetical protein
MAHDVEGLGVGLRLLVKEFHAGHLAALLGVLESVENEHRASVDAVEREEFDDEFKPALGEEVELDGVAVKEVQEAVIATFLEAEGPDEAGHAQQIAPHTEGGKSKNEPEEGAVSGEGGSEQADGVPPSDPKFHDDERNVAIAPNLA